MKQNLLIYLKLATNLFLSIALIYKPKHNTPYYVYVFACTMRLIANLIFNKTAVLFVILIIDVSLLMLDLTEVNFLFSINICFDMYQ